MKIQFGNKTARCLGTCTGRKLLPGKNVFEDMSEAELQQILSNEQFKGWQRLNWVSFIQPQAVAEEGAEPEPVSGAEDALVDLNVDEAMPVIAACSDTDLLLAWFEKDKRVTLKRAIEARIDELEPAEANEEGVVDTDENPEGVDEVFGG